MKATRFRIALVRFEHAHDVGGRTACSPGLNGWTILTQDNRILTSPEAPFFTLSFLHSITF